MPKSSALRPSENRLSSLQCFDGVIDVLITGATDILFSPSIYVCNNHRVISSSQCYTMGVRDALCGADFFPRESFHRFGCFR